MSTDPRSNTTTVSPNLPLKGSRRSSRPEVFLGKGVLKIFSKFTGEHPCRSAISIKLLCNLIEIALRHECSLVNLLHIFKNTFSKEHLWVTASVPTFTGQTRKSTNLLSRSLLSRSCSCWMTV